MAPAPNKLSILAFALDFLAANFDSATEENPAAFTEDDVTELAQQIKDGNAGNPCPENPVVPAVIEKCGEDLHVTLHPDDKAAEEHAAALAKENTSRSEDEIRENFKNRGSNEEGDYGVFLTNAVEIPATTAPTSPGKAPEEKACTPKLLVDGRPVAWKERIEVVFDQVDIPGEDDPKGALSIQLTHEGVILDVWGSREFHLDTNFGTSAETAAEIVDRLCREND